MTRIGLPPITDASLPTSDITTNNATTSKHGFVVKATAPSANVWNAVGIANGETAYTNKTIREVLSAVRTYYVRTDGSDSNTGLVDSAGGAFLTVVAAVNVVGGLDSSIYDLTIQIRDGTYVENVITLKDPTGAGNVTIQGNAATPTNVVLDGGFLKNTPGAIFTLKDMQIKKASSSATIGINSQNGAVIYFSGIDFGSGLTNHTYVTQNATIRPIGDYTISSGAARHIFTDAKGYFRNLGSITVTLSGTPNFTTTFAGATELAEIRSTMVFSGSATGKRYEGFLNAVINTVGGGASYFPGDSAGSVATGAQYA